MGTSPTNPLRKAARRRRALKWLTALGAVYLVFCTLIGVYLADVAVKPQRRGLPFGALAEAQELVRPAGRRDHGSVDPGARPHPAARLALHTAAAERTHGAGAAWRQHEPHVGGRLRRDDAQGWLYGADARRARARQQRRSARQLRRHRNRRHRSVDQVAARPPADGMPPCVRRVDGRRARAADRRRSRIRCAAPSPKRRSPPSAKSPTIASADTSRSATGSDAGCCVRRWKWVSGPPGSATASISIRRIPPVICCARARRCC